MIDNLLILHDNILEPIFAKHLFIDSLKKFTTGERIWSSSYHWMGLEMQKSNPWYIRDYEELEASLILNTLREKGIITNQNREYSVMNYVGTRSSYIPWHDDGAWDEAVTIYLNEYWQPNWGGMLLYKNNFEDQKLFGYEPRFNTAIQQKQGSGTGIQHSVSMISNHSECPRISIQVFPADRKW